MGRRPNAPRRRLTGVGWDCTATRRTIKAATYRVVQTAARKRQVPGNPKIGYTQLYGAPGTAGVSILSV